MKKSIRNMLLVFFAISFILLFYCNTKAIVARNLVFFTPSPIPIAWVDKNEIIFDSEKEQKYYYNIKYDQTTNQLYAYDFTHTTSTAKFYNITDGFNESDVLSIKISSQPSYLNNIENNKALFSLKDNSNDYLLKYMIIDLRTQESEYIHIPYDSFLGNWYNKHALGLMNNKIYFEVGYYDVLEKKGYKYKESFASPRLITNEEKIVAMDNNNFIVIYDLVTNKTQYTGIKRNLPFRHSAENLFFLDSKYLYISEDAPIFPANTSAYKSIMPHKWFRYDLITMEREKIYQPDKNASILGMFNEN